MDNNKRQFESFLKTSDYKGLRGDAMKQEKLDDYKGVYDKLISDVKRIKQEQDVLNEQIEQLIKLLEENVQNSTSVLFN